MDDAKRSCSAAHLETLCVDALVTCGITPADATTAATVLLYADLRSVTTHGAFNLTRLYAPQLRDRQISARLGPSTIVADTGAVTVLDGQRRLGLLVGVEAIDHAIARARIHGVAAVAVRNSTHFGAAGFYAARAAASGLVGLAMTNCGAGPLVAPLGGTRRLLGTNPIAGAAPSRGEDPFVLDGSTSVVATGKVRAAQRAGAPTPLGWLRHHDGTQTTDPFAYDDDLAELNWLGGELSTGGAKGFGLGLLVEILTGALSGAALGTDGAEADGGTGHLFVVFDPAAFVGSAAFLDAADSALDVIAQCPPAEGHGRVTYPGQMESESRRSALVDGVTLPEHVAAALDALAADLDVEPIAWSTP